MPRWPAKHRNKCQGKADHSHTSPLRGGGPKSSLKKLVIVKRLALVDEIEIVDQADLFEVVNETGAVVGDAVSAGRSSLAAI